MTTKEFAMEFILFADDLNVIKLDDDEIERETASVIEKVEDLDFSDFYEYLDGEIEEYGEDDFRSYPTRAEQAYKLKRWLTKYENDRM